MIRFAVASQLCIIVESYQTEFRVIVMALICWIVNPDKCPNVAAERHFFSVTNLLAELILFLPR